MSAVGEKLEHLPKILNEYEIYLKDVELHLSMKGKSIQQANVEHATWMSYYDQKRVELTILKKYMEKEVDRVRGKLWKQYTETNNRDLNTRDKENYINNETSYLVKHELYLEVLELSEKYEAVVDAFRSRGFALNNIVKLRVSAIENDII
jgi:hypothetical protein